MFNLLAFCVICCLAGGTLVQRAETLNAAGITYI